MADLDTLVQTIMQSAKYRHISPELVRHIGRRELSIRRSQREAVKATRSKLHQVGGAYWEGKIDYVAGLRLLQETAEMGLTADSAFAAACQQLMRHHASTRERLPVLQAFYATTLSNLPPIRRVMDIACGLNPLAWPWMPFDREVEYMAYDIYGDLMDFIQAFMAVAHIQGQAQVQDVISQPPAPAVDLVLLLKTLPCLAQVDKTAMSRLLDSLDAPYLLISYPVRSLGGRQKGMAENYEAQFAALSEGRSWTVERFEFETELAFLVQR